MARRTLTRGTLALAVTAAMAATAAPALAGTVRATAPAPALTIPAAAGKPVVNDVMWAGASGYLNQVGAQYRYTRYDGTVEPLAHRPAVLSSEGFQGGAGPDSVMWIPQDPATGKATGLEFDDLAAGTSVTVPALHGVTFVGQFGTRAVMLSTADGTLSVLTPHADGTADTVKVTGLPDGAVLPSRAVAGDARSVVLVYTDAAGARHLAVVDLATAVATTVPGTVSGTTSVLLGPDRMGWTPGGSQQSLSLVDRSDVTATPDTVTLPTAAGAILASRFAGRWIVSDHLVSPDDPYDVLTATDPDTGRTVTFPGRVTPQSLAQAPDGAAFVVGSTDETHWSAERVTAPGTGDPVATPLSEVATTPLAVTGLALTGGRLFTHHAGEFSPAYRRDITLGAGTTPSYGDAVPVGTPPGDPGRFTGTGTGIARLHTAGSEAQAFVGVQGGDRIVDLGPAGGTLVAADDDWVVYDGGSPAKQYVVPTGNAPGFTSFTRAPAAAALVGETLWTAGAGGTLTPTALPDRTAAGAVAHTGASCTPDELQAAGRWLYWACADGTAGAHDVTTGANVRVPAGPALLGDGYVVRQDTARGELVLTGISGDTAAPDQDLAPYTGGAAADERGLTWSVDAFAGGVAWAAADGTVRIADPGTTASPVKVIAVRDAENVAAPGRDAPWTAQWSLSRPAASATVTIAEATGHVLRTVPATPEGSALAASWDGRTASGAPAPDASRDTWTLTVTDPDGHRTTASGHLAVQAGAPGFRSYNDDGAGSLITLNADGYLTTHLGAGTVNGLFGDKRGGAGWTTKALAVPFGDLNGDGCEDTLVRMSSGELRDYHTACDSTLSTPAHAYTSLGSGFGQYKWLGSSGDMTGDGRPDLLAWSTSTGDLSLYPGLAGGKLGAPRLLKANQTYVRLAAPGDVNGDGTGDLLAYDHAHTLWLLTGDGKGGLTARKSVFTNWGSGYTTLTGAGDVNNDGRPDLVERDTSGTLWVNYGRAGDTFSGRTKAATGWGGYLAIF